MEHILSVLIEVSIYSAVIAITVLAVRKCFAKRMNPAFMIALWAVVLVRFCLPVTLESPVHVDAFFPPKAVKSVNDTPTPEVYEGAYNAQDPNIANYEIPTPAAMPSVPQDNTAVLPSEAVPEAKQISPYALIIGVWLAGAASVILVFAVKAIHLAVYVGRSPQLLDQDMLSILREKKTQLGIKRKVTVKVCNRIYAPALYGVFQPVILLPKKYLKMSAYDLEAIFAHELMHLKKHDILLGYVWLIVKAIHWFNPLAWIAYSKYLEDVELCRDSQAAAFMEDGAIHYGSALLNAARLAEFTSDTVLPAASLFKKKSALKERVVRMVKPQQRSKVFSAVSACVVIVTAMLCFTTACQPTPDEPAIIVRDNEMYLEEIAQGDNAASISFPEEYVDIIDTGNQNVSLSIRASVAAPALEKYAVFSASPEFLSQEMVDTVRVALMGDKTMYNPLSVTDITQEEALMHLSSFKQTQAELRSRNESSAYVDEMISYYEEKLKTAPVTIERTINDGKFGDKQPVAVQKSDAPPVPTLLPPGNDYNRITASVDLGKETFATFSAYRSDSGKLSYIWLENTGEFYLLNQYKVNRSDIEQLSLTFAEAKDMAQTLIKNMKLDDMKVFAELSVTAVNPREDQQSRECYLFVFTKEFNGIPAMYHKPIMYHKPEDGAAAYVEPWTSEYVSVVIDDTGIVHFAWESPTIVKQVNESVSLLPFDSAMDYFARHCKSALSWIDESIKEIEIEISEIRLCMAKISTGADEYLYVPAWDFIGTSQITMADGRTTTHNSAEQSYFTVNAIDGSIIDEGLGY